MIKLPEELSPEDLREIAEYSLGIKLDDREPEIAHAIWLHCLAEVQRLNATAQPVSDGWIKCSERLPDDNGRYLVLFIWMNSGPPVVNIADFQHTAYETPIMTWNYPREARITHWMPLPAAPGGQDD